MYLEQNLCDWQVDEILKLSRKEILFQVSGVRSSASVRYLSKVKVEQYNEHWFGLLKISLSAPDLISYLSQFKCITSSMLKYAIQAKAFLGCYLLRHLPHETKKINNTLRSVAILAPDSLRAGKYISEPDIFERINACRSEKALKRLHDEMVRKHQVMQKCHLYSSYQEHFPEPPLPGTDSIVPITTLTDLFEEGESMHHCVATYAEKVFKNNIYIYKVLTPERATLTVGNLGQRPCLAQLALACNREPNKETYRVVEQFISEQTKLLDLRNCISN